VDDPLAALNSADLASSLAIAVGLTLACWVVIPRLTTDEAPRGILSFELSWSAARARQIVERWKQLGMVKLAKLSVLLDLPLIACYGWTLLAAGVLAARAAGASGALSPDDAATAAAWMAAAALVVVILDLLENIGLWLMLNDKVSGALAMATSLVSLVKWALIAFAPFVIGGLLLMAGCALVT